MVRLVIVLAAFGQLDAGSVAHAQDDVLQTHEAPPPLPQLFAPPAPEAPQDEDDEVLLGPEELSNWGLRKEEIGWFQRIVDFFWAWLVWFVTPICVLFETFLNWLGFPETGGTIDFTLGAVGYFCGMVDAWVPLHETISYAINLSAICIVWLPFKLIVKYFFPGLG